MNRDLPRLPELQQILKVCWGCMIFAFSLTVSGCVWRTAEAEYFIGPIVFRSSQPESGEAYVWEEKPIFPLTLEIGEHNGLTTGFLTRIAANPIDPPRNEAIEWCSWAISFSCSRPSAATGWHWSLLYSRVTHGRSPEFIERNLIGASVGIGAEGRYLTVGYSAKTQLRPRDNAYYLFCYGRDNPLQMRFRVTTNPLAFTNSLNLEACK